MAYKKNEEIVENVTFTGVKIGFRNFSGEEGRYNRKGARNFCVFLDPDSAESLKRDGWNVKQTKENPKVEDWEPLYYIKVNVNFNGPRPPKIALLTSRGKTYLTEDTVNVLDYANIKNVDFIMVPYHYEIVDTSGISAYLKTMFVEIEEDELEEKYADWGESA